MKKITLLIVILAVAFSMLATSMTTAFDSPIPTEAGCYPGPYCGPRWTDTPAPITEPTATFVPSPLESFAVKSTTTTPIARPILDPTPALLPVSGGGND